MQILVPSNLNCDVGISRKFSCVRIQFNCYENISRKSSCVLIRIVTLVSCANLAVLIFGLLRSYLICYASFSRKCSSIPIWVVTSVSCANSSVFLFGVLKYLKKSKPLSVDNVIDSLENWGQILFNNE